MVGDPLLFQIGHWFSYKLNNIYYINTNEIPGELSRENMISLHVKISENIMLFSHVKK